MDALWFLIPPLCSWADRHRGDGKAKLPGAVRKLLYGLVAGIPLLILGVAPVVYAVWAVVFALASAPGWGYPYGIALGGEPNPAGPESWQFHDKLVDNEWLALTFRGFMWGGVSLLFIPYVGVAVALIYAVAMTVAMPAGAYLARDMKPFESRWPNSEYIRGVLYGLIICLTFLV
jgi:hypothetical protein